MTRNRPPAEAEIQAGMPGQVRSLEPPAGPPPLPEDATRDEWARWIIGYTPAAFYEAFMRTAQGARSRCVQCGETITLDIREGGGIADWQTLDGDYGCWASPDTGEDGTGSHVAEGVEA